MMNNQKQRLIDHIVSNDTCQGEIEAALAFGIPGVIDGLDKTWLESDAGQTVLAELNLAWPLYDTEPTAPPQSDKFLEVEQHAVDAIPFWQQFEQVTEEVLEEYEQEKHADRLTHCRLRRGWIMDPISLTWKSYLQKCGYWRNQECPHCFGDRKREFKNRITFAIKNQHLPVYILPTNDPLVPELKKELESKDYLRLPTNGADGGLFFYNAANRAKLGQQVLSVNQIDDDKWDEVTDTPKGSRPSGHLGKPEEEEKNEENGWRQVDSGKMIVATENDEQVQKLWKQTVKEYNESEDKKELNNTDDLNERTQRLFSALEDKIDDYNYEAEKDPNTEKIEVIYTSKCKVWVRETTLGRILKLFYISGENDVSDDDSEPPF